MNGYVTAAITWLEQHPHEAGVAVFLVNLSESLVVVGLFVPGTLVMFGIGALVSVGAMGLQATLLWAIAGALAGDGISYLIGRHYHERLRILWPFRQHPEWLERAERFFERHGAKSVVFGRFAGPVRPIIPAVAGMMGMSAGRFYWANFLSAITWAPAYILPGVVFGASLGLATQVATRFLLTLVLLLLLLWLIGVLLNRVYVLLRSHVHPMVAAVAIIGLLISAGYWVTRYLDEQDGSNRSMTFLMTGDLKTLAQNFTDQGWQAVPFPEMAHLLRVFVPIVKISDLPVLPRIYDGRLESLRMIRCDATNTAIFSCLILRLWANETQSPSENQFVWVGHVMYQRSVSLLGLMTVPVECELALQ